MEGSKSMKADELLITVWSPVVCFGVYCSRRSNRAQRSCVARSNHSSMKKAPRSHWGGRQEASDLLLEHSAGSGSFRRLCWGSVGELKTLEVCVCERERASEREKELSLLKSSQISQKSWLKLNTNTGRGSFQLAPDQQQYSERWRGLWGSELQPRRLKPCTFL